MFKGGFRKQEWNRKSYLFPPLRILKQYNNPIYVTEVNSSSKSLFDISVSQGGNDWSEIWIIPIESPSRTPLQSFRVLLGPLYVKCKRMSEIPKRNTTGANECNI